MFLFNFPELRDLIIEDLYNNLFSFTPLAQHTSFSKLRFIVSGQADP